MLQKLQDNGTVSAVFLKNGIRLIGKIIRFDSEDIHITSPSDQLGMSVSRDAIATIGAYHQTANKETSGMNKR
jgi:sRNA-binding regulator protein Hfq